MLGLKLNHVKVKEASDIHLGGQNKILFSAPLSETETPTRATYIETIYLNQIHWIAVWRNNFNIVNSVYFFIHKVSIISNVHYFYKSDIPDDDLEGFDRAWRHIPTDCRSAILMVKYRSPKSFTIWDQLLNVTILIIP